MIHYGTCWEGNFVAPWSGGSVLTLQSPSFMISNLFVLFLFIAVDRDPNRAPPCDQTQCVLPDCYCSPDGTQIPGKLEPNTVPQMITITFDDAVNNNNIIVYERIFKDGRNNPNGCSAKGTFFVSHKYTNYSAVQELHRKGHEIAAHSIT